MKCPKCNERMTKSRQSASMEAIFYFCTACKIAYHFRQNKTLEVFFELNNGRNQIQKPTPQELREWNQ